MRKNGIIDQQEKEVVALLFLALITLIIPAFLIFVERLTGHAELIEELAKTILIFFLLKNSGSRGIKTGGAIFIGLSFALAENFFYLNNFLTGGIADLFWRRFFLSLPMHLMTSSILLVFFQINRWPARVIGFTLALIIHLAFNLFIQI